MKRATKDAKEKDPFMGPTQPPKVGGEMLERVKNSSIGVLGANEQPCVTGGENSGEARKAAMGVIEQPCVTGREMFTDLNQVKRKQEDGRALKRTNLGAILEKLREREKEIYRKNGYYVTAQEVLKFNSSFIFTSNSWNPETRESDFEGKSNPEVDGVKYLVGLVAMWGGVKVLIYVPYMDQKEPHLVFMQGKGDGRDEKKALDVVKSYAARYGQRLDELEAGKLEKRK